MTAPVRYEQLPFALAPDVTELVLVRHGASAAATPGVAFPLQDGHDDPPLAPLGLEQAERVGERLRGEAIDALFVSGLTRTVQTAAPLAAAIGLQPVVVPELREVHLGDWQGGVFRQKMADRDPVVLRMLAEERWDVIPGAESSERFGARVRKGLQRVARETGPGRRAVVVAHGGVIGELCHQAAASRPFAFVWPGSENGALTRILAGADGTWVLRSFNDTAHLAGLA